MTITIPRNRSIESIRIRFRNAFSASELEALEESVLGVEGEFIVPIS